MKKFYYSLLFSSILAALTFMFTACGDDNDDDNPQPPSYGLVKKDLSVGYEAADLEFKFEAPTTWRVKCDAGWVTPSRTQGSAGNVTLMMSVDQNLTGAERTAHITFETTAESKTFIDLTLKQDAKPVKPSDDTNGQAPAGMKSNAKYLLSQIKVGWNLGNTCESGIWDGWSGNDLDIETNWGNPKTSQQTIDAVKAAGFNAIRIPVRWYVHADANLNINQAWLNRVKEIVDYAYNQGMYVVLNSHHDNWYDRLPQGYNAADIKNKFGNMWTQIATFFKDYDEHLILAGVNEVVYLDAAGNEVWSNPTDEHIKFLGELMQIFVDKVRATGGNNAWRCLMVQPWAANVEYAYHKGFSMPNDKVDQRLILEFHYYTWTYSTESAGSANKYFWGKDYSKYTPWYSNGENEVTALLNKVQSTYVDNGVAVMMAEFGCVQHNASKDEAACDQSRAYYHKFVVSEAKKRGIPGFYWDNGAFDGNGENFGIIDRKNNTVPARAKIALDGIMAGAN